MKPWIVYFYDYEIHLDNSSTKHQKLYCTSSLTNIIQMYFLLVDMKKYKYLTLSW